jgi:hypothetical protein
VWLDLFREKKPRQFRVDVSWVLISAWNVLSFSAGGGEVSAALMSLPCGFCPLVSLRYGAVECI